MAACHETQEQRERETDEGCLPRRHRDRTRREFAAIWNKVFSQSTGLLEAACPDHRALEKEAAATVPRSERPFSNWGPHILSQSMNTLITLPMKLFLPYIAHVTTVLSPSGLKVKSTVAVPSIGRFQSIRQRTSSPGLLSMMVQLPAPTLRLPSQLHTAPTPDSGPQ